MLSASFSGVHSWISALKSYSLYTMVSAAGPASPPVSVAEDSSSVAGAVGSPSVPEAVTDSSVCSRVLSMGLLAVSPEPCPPAPLQATNKPHDASIIASRMFFFMYVQFLSFLFIFCYQKVLFHHY